MDKEWFEQLTDEQKEKLRGMDGDPEALIAFCKEEKLGLSDDILEAVSGGRIGDGWAPGCREKVSG